MFDSSCFFFFFVFFVFLFLVFLACCLGFFLFNLLCFLSGSQERQTIVNGIGQMAELRKEGSG